MSAFVRRLRSLAPPSEGQRTWVYVPYDQLTDAVGPLSRTKPEALGIVLAESRAKAARRPYHKQKLALILTNLRHFALEQAERGVAVRYLFLDGTYADGLRSVVEEVGPLITMRPAERELRSELAPLVDEGVLSWVDHEGWLTTTDEFDRSQKRRETFRMDAFYRAVRKRTGWLMSGGKPEGGKFSFDADNRKAWPGEPPEATPPRFDVDEITAEVGALIEETFSDHPGRLDLAALPACQEHAEETWKWAKAACLPEFGPFEDAMSHRARNLFHTRLSPLINLHRLPPQRVVTEAVELDAPLASREGFVRQILGWREFVRHVHEATDGFRDLPFETPPETEGLAVPSFLGAERPLPPAFWGEASGLACLDHVVESVWDEGYSHHITRLMVLSNLATLLDVSPRELTDWFWVAYIDAYDWVVEPNVLGMGTYAAGDVMTTKPYVSGAAYIDKMSDYCGPCAFHPKKTCPITPMYWAFLHRQRERLADNHRIRLPLRSAEKRPADQRAEDERLFEAVSRALSNGDVVSPETLAP